jgi:hypothetical protein
MTKELEQNVLRAIDTHQRVKDGVYVILSH